MNIHKNARLTFARRLEMVHQMSEQGVSPSTAGRVHAVSVATVRKWLGRYLAQGMPVTAAYSPDHDIWFRYRDERDLDAWFRLLPVLLPGVLGAVRLRLG